MKSILILGATVLLIVFVVMFFIDNVFWPEHTLLKIKNIFLILLAVYLSYNIISIYFLKKEKAESALVYKTARAGKLFYMKILNHIRPFQKEFLIWIIAAAVLSFLGFATMGTPGIIFLEGSERLGIFNKIETADTIWPAAIFISILWPFCLPAGVLVKHFLRSRGYAAYALIGWIGTTTAGILFLILISHCIFGKS